MLDATLRRFVDPPLNRIGAGIARAGVSANAVTIAGFLIGMAALPLLAGGHYLAALLLILVNRIFDGLDGAVARQTRLSDFGGYLDIVFDFIFYSAVAFGFALGDPAHALPALFLVWSFVGTGTTFLAYAILAERYRITTEIRGAKSLYYLGGLTEGTETIVAMALFCLLPEHFPLLALIFGAMCWITTATRVAAAWMTFGRNPPRLPRDDGR
ncbi:CDP-alcohol phosphatidyltransferase family protein [Oceanibacterium hippocampi]|nr:CDP-alcohol phosphatidyltransferase family protein [Oceanibacterium hippocampi]